MGDHRLIIIEKQINSGLPVVVTTERIKSSRNILEYFILKKLGPFENKTGTVAVCV